MGRSISVIDRMVSIVNKHRCLLSRPHRLGRIGFTALSRRMGVGLSEITEFCTHIHTGRHIHRYTQSGTHTFKFVFTHIDLCTCIYNSMYNMGKYICRTSSAMVKSTDSEEVCELKLHLHPCASWFAHQQKEGNSSLHLKGFLRA